MKTVSWNLIISDEPLSLVEERLKEIRPYVDEVVIVRDGRLGPKHRSLAKKFDAFLACTRSKHNHAAIARRIALAYTEADWVLVCDLDEYPTEAFLSKMKDLINPEDDIGAYWVRMKQLIDGQLTKEYWRPNLFRVTMNVRWIPFPHSLPQGLGLDGLRLVFLEDEDCYFEHRQGQDEFHNKELRYTKVVGELLKKHGDMPKARKHLLGCIKGYQNDLASRLRREYNYEEE